jgi:putative Mn2+ efflux pump MntP
MFWLSAALVAVVSNLDNLTVGFGFGVRGRPIARGPNLIIAAVTMAGTAGAMTSGRTFSAAVSLSVASTLGATIIIAIGLWTVVVSLRAVSCAVQHVPWDRVGGEHELLGCDPGGEQGLSFRKAVGLGAALAMNNVGTGLGAGVAGISPLVTTLLAGAVSLVCVGGGSRIGSFLGRLLLGRWAPPFSGLILLGLGTAMLSGAG